MLPSGCMASTKRAGRTRSTASCQRRSDSRPEGRSKSRPLRVSGVTMSKGPRLGPFVYRLRGFGSGGDDLAGVRVDDIGGLVLLRPAGGSAAAISGLL